MNRNKLNKKFETYKNLFLEKIKFITNNFSNKFINKFLIVNLKRLILISKEIYLFCSSKIRNIVLHKLNKSILIKVRTIVIKKLYIVNRTSLIFLKVFYKILHRSKKNISYTFKRIRIKFIKRFNYFLKRKKNPKVNEDIESIDLGLLPPPPIWSRIFIWTLTAGSTFLISWSFIAKIEDTVSVSGEITTLKPKVIVNSRDQGVIENIYVKPNQRIQKGDLIITYKDDETSLRIFSAEKRLDLLQQEKKTITDNYLVKFNKYKENYKLQSLIVERLETLYKGGAISEVEYLERESKMKQLLIDMDQLKIDMERDVINNRKSIQELQSLLFELLAKKRRFKIKSPTTGYILDLKYQTVGQRIKNEDEIASIIPEKDFIARVMIPSRLRAPISINMKADVEVDAFPSTDFGSINSIITSLAPTSTSSSQQTQRSYMADLTLLGAETPELLNISELRPGMTVVAKLKLRKKPVIASIFNIISDLFVPLSEEK